MTTASNATSLVSPEYFVLLMEILNKKKDYAMTTPLTGLKSTIKVYACYFPAFATDEALKFAENGFQGPDEFYHKMHALLGTSELQYTDVLVFEYPVEPPPKFKGYFRYCHLSFIVFYTQQGLVLLYNDMVMPYMDIVKNFSTATRFENLTPEVREKAVEQLETGFYAMLKKAKVTIPDSVSVPPLIRESLQKQDDKKLLEELIRLMFRNDIAPEDLEEILNEMVAAHKSPRKYQKKNPDYAYLESEEVMAAVLRYYLPSASSDWKFDPEDLEMYISDLIDEPFTLDLPVRKTYSHDLFPFADKQLAEKGLMLLNYDTQGDSYEFLVVNREDLSRISWLCQRFRVPIDRVG